MTEPSTRYAARYCEENIYQLCRAPEHADRPRTVVFISNAARACPLWQQRAGAPGEAVWWDYHVVLLGRDAGDHWLVWDLDTRLACPVPAPIWLAHTFSGLPAVPASRWPRFRVLPAAEYLARLRSDRGHMRGPDGEWLAPPPDWPPPGDGAAPSNLMRFVDLETPFAGEVLSFRAFAARYGHATGTGSAR